MPVFEVTSRVTRRSLMHRTKDELASRVLELMDLLDQERAKRAQGDTDLEVVWAELNSATDTVTRQSEILTRVVNALRGDPPAGTQWSHSDADALAETERARLDEVKREVRLLAYPYGNGSFGRATVEPDFTDLCRIVGLKAEDF